MSAEPNRAPDADADGLPGSDRIGHLLWETSTRAMVMAEPLLEELQLSLPSMGALERIAAEPGITASELARRAFKTQQAVSQVTSRLERLGYVERRLGSGRGVGLHATRLGIAALAEGTTREAEVDERLRGMLGAEDAERLRALLRRLREALVVVTTEPTPAEPYRIVRPTMAPLALRPRRVGEILDAAIKLYLGNARVLMSSAAAIVVPLQILAGVVMLSAYSDGHDISSGFGSIGQTITPAEAHARLGASAINDVTAWIAAAFVLGACVKALSDAYLGQVPTTSDSLRFGLRRLLPLLGLTIVYTIGQLLGFVALIVTGIWLYGMWSVRVPALVIERAGPFKSLGRSYGLVKGRWWPVAGVLIVSSLMLLVVGGLIGGALAALAISNGNPSVLFAVTISVLSGIVSGVLVQPFSAAVVTVLYYDLRIRREGFDLQLLADQLGLEASALPTGPDGGYRAPIGPEDVGKPGGPPYWPPPPGWRPSD